MKLELNESSFKPWNTITIRHLLNGLSGIGIGLPNPAGLYTNLSFEDMPIKVYLGWDTDDPPLLFDGFHDDPSWSVAKAKVSMSLTGRDFGRTIFDELTVDDDFNSYGNPNNHSYIIDYIKYLADNLYNALPLLFSRNTVVDDDEDFKYVFEHGKVIEAVRKLASYGGYEWLMTHDQDDNRQWIVRPPKSLTEENVGHAFIVGDESRYTDIPGQANTHLVGSISVKRQYGYKKNYVKVQGNGVSGVYPLSPPSNPKHLYHEDDGIISVDDALAVASRIWAERSAPKTLVDFSGIGVEQLRVGDIIYVNDFRYGASQLPSNIFRLIEINDTISKGGGWSASFKVADFVPTMFQFFSGTEGL